MATIMIAQPINSRAESCSPRTAHPANTANTDSRLIVSDAIVGLTLSWATIWSRNLKNPKTTSKMMIGMKTSPARNFPAPKAARNANRIDVVHELVYYQNVD